MQEVTIGESTYQFVRDFKDNEVIRKGFNQMTMATFGFSLENWYQNGFWQDYYIPYALLHENQLVSNVSINRLDFNIDGKHKIGIQIGTVMTKEGYRNQGLNKYLLEQVIQSWKNASDFIYLFANSTVLEFYPKFGFERVKEYQYSRTVMSNSTSTMKKLDMDKQKDVALLVEKINNSSPLSRISLRNNPSLILFYCTSFMKHCVFEIGDIIVIAEITGDTLQLHDVFHEEPTDLDSLIQQLAGPEIRRVVLGFTPLDTSNYQRSELKADDTFFVRKESADQFKDQYWMFPVLSHA